MTKRTPSRLRPVLAASAIALGLSACGVSTMTSSTNTPDPSGAAGTAGDDAHHTESDARRDIGREANAHTDVDETGPRTAPTASSGSLGEPVVDGDGVTDEDIDEGIDDDTEPTPSTTVPITVPPVFETPSAPEPPTPPVDPGTSGTDLDLGVGTVIEVPITSDPVLIPLAPCGVVGPVAASATVYDALDIDLDGDGDLDRVSSIIDGADWRLRFDVDGVISEIDVPGVGAHAVNLLGTSDVGAVTPGDALLATVGGGASFVNVGFFGIDDTGCAFQFQASGGDAFIAPVGATVGNGSGVFCGGGIVGLFGWELDVDDTYFAWSAGYEEVVPGVLSYLSASDDFAEGLELDELTPADVDCPGASL